MRVLITGASGNLASGLIELLEGRHELRLSDIEPMTTRHQFVRADVRRREQLMPAARGIDVIVHTPAWHGIHRSSRSEVEFWDLNVDGTFNMLQAAVAHGVPKVVWMSSAAVRSRDNIYGLSKVIGEEVCQFYHRVHGIRCVMLRPGDFTPYRNRKQYGERLLRGGVDRRDVHQVAALAVEDDTIACEAFPISREDPFGPDEVEAWPNDPGAVLERYVPEARSLVDRYGLDLPERVNVPDIAVTKQKLGYRPRYNFITFLRELAERDARREAADWLEQA